MRFCFRDETEVKRAEVNSRRSKRSECPSGGRLDAFEDVIGWMIALGGGDFAFISSDQQKQRYWITRGGKYV